VARELFDAGILDRLTLKIHPVVAETGRRLFEPGHHTTPPGLDRPDHTPAGNVVDTYRRKN